MRKTGKEQISMGSMNRQIICMHLALITGDRFCADFAHLKQALLLSL